MRKPCIGHGKHVHCEKPLAHSVGEVRPMRKAALEQKEITRVGNQGHSAESIRRFVEMVQSGAIGNWIRHVLDPSFRAPDPGMVAIRRTGQRLAWDDSAMKFTNDEEANTFLKPVSRPGWEIQDRFTVRGHTSPAARSMALRSCSIKGSTQAQRTGCPHIPGSPPASNFRNGWSWTKGIQRSALTSPHFPD